MQPQKLPLDLTPPDPKETQDNLSLQVLKLSLSKVIAFIVFVYFCSQDSSDDGDSSSAADVTANKDQVTPSKKSTADKVTTIRVMHK